MRRLKSDIPPHAEEIVVSPTVREYRLRGEVVGRRCFNAAGQLISESPLRDGKKHGREFTWDDDGTLLSVEPYFDGKIDGTAKQYDRGGGSLVHTRWFMVPATMFGGIRLPMGRFTSRRFIPTVTARYMDSYGGWNQIRSRTSTGSGGWELTRRFSPQRSRCQSQR